MISIFGLWRSTRVIFIFTPNLVINYTPGFGFRETESVVLETEHFNSSEI